MVRLTLLWCIIYAWGTVEWQLCNEDENWSLLWREKKPFSLNRCLGPFLISAVHVGQSCGVLSGCAENPARDSGALGRLSGASDQQLCFVSISIILLRVESTRVCAKLLASRTRNRIASISCAEAVSKGSFPSLTTLTGSVICSVVVYLSLKTMFCTQLKQ